MMERYIQHKWAGLAGIVGLVAIALIAVIATSGTAQAWAVSPRDGPAVTEDVRLRAGHGKEDVHSEASADPTVSSSGDATLSSLTLVGNGEPVELSPAFDPDITTYLVAVTTGDVVIQAATTKDTASIVSFTVGDKTGKPVSEDDKLTTQAQIPAGAITGLSLIVKAEDGASTKTYHVLAARPSQQMMPEITIEANRSEYVAGIGPLVFTLNRTGDTAAELDVTVDIIQDETWLASTTHDVAFDDGEATTTLILSPERFSSDVIQSGTLTATVAAVDGYDTSSATVSVSVISQEGPAVTVSFEESEYTVIEGEGEFNPVLVARAAMGVPHVAEFSVDVSSHSDGASSTEDFAAYSEATFFFPTDFVEVEGSLVATTTLTLTIVDDEISELDEQFGLELARAPGESFEVDLLDPDGDSCGVICQDHYPVTILDDDGLLITIEANRSEYVAGIGPLIFTLNRAGDTSAALDVTVDVAQDETWLSSTSHDVTFGAGDATATLTLSHSDFSSDVTESGTLTATVASILGYNTSRATVSVSVISQEGPAVTVSFEESEYTIAEDAGEFSPVLVARAAAGVPYVDEFSVQVSASDIGASSPGDFDAYSETIDFASADFTEVEGSLVAKTTLALTIVDDETFEVDEQFGLALSKDAGASSEVGLQDPDGDSCGLACEDLYPVTILDDDASLITIEASRSEYVAALGSLVFTLSRAGDTSAALDVTIDVAQDEMWLSSTSHDVAFDVGDATATLTLSHSDFSSDVTESGTLTATVASILGYNTSRATVSVSVISQDGPAVTVSFEESEYTVAEGAGEFSPVLVARAAAGVPYVDEFSVQVSASDIGASSPGDFDAYSETIAFASTDFTEVEGSLVAKTTLALTIVDDETFEEDEQFGLALSKDAGASSEVGLQDPDGDSCGLVCEDLYPVTILDDDASLITIEANRSEYVAGLGPLIFTLNRAGDTASALDVTIAVAQDETWLSSTSHDVTFGAGDATATLTLSHSDFSSDVTESGTLTATVAAVTGYDTSSATVSVSVISQDGPAVTVSFEESEYTVAEDADEFSPVLVAQAASGVSYVDEFKVTVTTSPLGASSTEDYVHYSETLTFASTDFAEVGGSLVAKISPALTIVDDETFEEDEQFGLELSKDAGVSSEVGLQDPDGDSCGLVCEDLYPVTILDDDASLITIEASRSEYVAGLGPLFFTLNRTGDTSAELDVTVDIIQDEIWLESTTHDVAFDAGEATTTLIFSPVHFSSDVTESGILTATVAAESGYDTSSATVSVNVISQEGPAFTVSFEESEYTVAEDAGQFSPVLVARAAAGVPYVDAFGVSVVAKAIDATSPEDYGAYSEILTFVPADFAEVEGSLVGRITATLTIIDDEAYEGDKQFELELARGVGVSSEVDILDPDGDSCGVTCQDHYPVTILDDDGIPITIDASRSEYVAGLGPLIFTLNRGGLPASDLDVTVDIVQDETWLSSTSHDVVFDVGESTTTLTLTHSDFSSDVTQSGTLTATVASIFVYDTSRATVSVSVISQEGPAVTVSLEESEYTVAEDAGQFSPVLVARVEAGVPYVEEFDVSVVASAIEASSPEDYVAYVETLTFVPTDFAEVDGSLVAKIAVILTIVDDETSEVDERFELQLGRVPSTPLEVGLLDSSGALCGSTCENHYPVTIVDDEGDPSFNVGALAAFWTHTDDADDNLLSVGTCTGPGSFRVIWEAREDGRGADEWEAHITTHGGMSAVSYSFMESDALPPGSYEMNGTVEIEGEGHLTIRVRGRFGDIWGTWSPPVGLYCDDDGDLDFSLGTLGAFWTHTDDADGNLLPPGSCTGSGSFRIIWDAREDGRGADEWDARITTYGGMSAVSHSFMESDDTYPPGSYEMNGTVNIEGEGHLTIRVRGRFGDIWGAWSPPVGLYCLESLGDES